MISKAETVKKIRNLREAKALVEKYRSLTVEKLSEAIDRFMYPNPTLLLVLSEITFFGSRACTLCQRQYHDSGEKVLCSSCIFILNRSVNDKEIDYNNKFYCTRQFTFKAICDFGRVYATNIEDAVRAIRARADYIEHLIEIAIENGAEKSQFE